jgi:hypothetical protein
MARPFFAAVGLVFIAHTYAWAQGPVPLAATAHPVTTTTTAGGTTAAQTRWKKFEGSALDLYSYIGSGSFYTGYGSNSYASLALFARPNYDLGTPYKLALRGRIILEEELTAPDNPTGRRFHPYDPWIWLAADNLRTFERSKIKIGGTLRTVWPLSHESRYRHDIVSVGLGPNVSRAFEFGDVSDEARKWTLRASYGVLFSKSFQTSNFRGSGPGDTTGCMAPTSPAASGGTSGPSGSSADTCGGPANTNFAFMNSFALSLARGKASLTVSLAIFNDFKYAYPDDAVAPGNAVPRGRSDSTWGIIAAGYKLRPHLSVGLGISSFQPALDSRYRYPRFPFWDFSGANFNNYSQIFISVGGSL